mgnify:FL=1
MTGPLAGSPYPSFGRDVTMWMTVGPVPELSTDSPNARLIGSHSVLLSYRNSSWWAIANICPHRGEVLSDGLVQGDCVTCPGHFWRCSLTDCRKQGDERARVAPSPLRLVDDVLEIEVPDPAPTHTLREILLAHARAEDTND